jgi:hypothetical protein
MPWETSPGGNLFYRLGQVTAVVIYEDCRGGTSVSYNIEGRIFWRNFRDEDEAVAYAVERVEMLLEHTKGVE